MIIVAAFLGYGTGGVLFFRWCYGILRAHSIDYNRRRYPFLYTEGEAIQRWNYDDRSFVIFAASALAIIWPLTALGFAIRPLVSPLRSFLMGSSVQSQFENDINRRKLEEHIAALEAENERLRQTQEN